MDTIDHALRLLQTEEAGLGTGLALLVIVAAALVVMSRAVQGEFRPVPALLIVAAGVVVGAGIANLTYDAWYRHRCIEHHSDIPECSAGWQPPTR